MENVTEETNDHKKRQRRKKKERKQENIEEIISRFCAVSDIIDNLSTVFKPVQIRQNISKCVTTLFCLKLNKALSCFAILKINSIWQ